MRESMGTCLLRGQVDLAAAYLMVANIISASHTSSGHECTSLLSGLTQLQEPSGIEHQSQGAEPHTPPDHLPHKFYVLGEVITVLAMPQLAPILHYLVALLESTPWGSAEPLVLLFSAVMAALPSSHCILRQVGLHLQIFLAKPSKQLEACANHILSFFFSPFSFQICSVLHFSLCFSKCGY